MSMTVNVKCLFVLNVVRKCAPVHDFSRAGRDVESGPVREQNVELDVFELRHPSSASTPRLE